MQSLHNAMDRHLAGTRAADVDSRPAERFVDGELMARVLGITARKFPAAQKGFDLAFTLGAATSSAQPANYAS